VRKNIFELLSEDFDVTREIRTIWHLFTREVNINTFAGYFNESKNFISILDCVNSQSFMNWKSRNRSVSPQDMMDRLGIDENFVYELSAFSNNMICVLEFIINMLALCEIAVKELHFEFNVKYQILKENIVAFIEHFGYETHNFKEEEQIILIEKNPTVTSAAEISEPEIAKKIIQYNHYSLKGDIEAKKAILLTLANEVEPHRKELEKENASFSKDLFFMFNNMNLRHNNKEPSDKNYRSFIATMDENTLESWYDEIYQMILLAKLLLDNVTRMANIKTLKNNIIGTQNEPETGS
jgi:hypothetical protein